MIVKKVSLMLKETWGSQLDQFKEKTVKTGWEHFNKYRVWQKEVDSCSSGKL